MTRKLFSTFRLLILIVLFFAVTLQKGYSQTAVSQTFINQLKEDPRGPYRDIKWFCSDGTIREARDPCPEPLEGVQHARLKESVLDIAKGRHIFLEQILTGTDYADFWDARNDQSRLKQYLLTRFLFNNDDGWILRKAQFYRGAKQSEDEQEWGRKFFLWLLQNNAPIEESFGLVRMAANSIDHGVDGNESQLIRAYSKILADDVPSFMDIRIKIHNNPSKSDLAATKEWLNKNSQKIDANARTMGNKLVDVLQSYYASFDLNELASLPRFLPEDSDFRKKYEDKIAQLGGYEPYFQALQLSELLALLRDGITDSQWNEARLKIIDLSNQVENQIIRDLSTFQPASISDVRYEMCYLVQGLYGGGYLEKWEYEMIQKDLDWMAGDTLSIHHLSEYEYALNKLLAWCTQHITATFNEVIASFSKFEPKAYGLSDDLIRSSLILRLGMITEQYSNELAKIAGRKHELITISATGGVRGLNPGLAKGVLRVIEDAEAITDLNSNNIYAFQRPPSDLGPVAGILNVEDGNPVSHVQLLARNLGIPNAIVTNNLLKQLGKYDGQEIFYAVSNDGTVRMKLASEMTTEEKNIFDKGNRQLNKFTISTDNLNLQPDTLLRLSSIDAGYSGIWCGPKAANLGQLKIMFPDNVVDGVVLPFGVFKDHMMQKIPGREVSYWDFLGTIFRTAETLKKEGSSELEIEKFTLEQLEELRALIIEMPLKISLIAKLEKSFIEIFNQPLGRVPVFLRSDTNMEDLPNFTGAGLNLTLFNVVDRNEILNGIKRVWASPYTERSYKWRQKILNNPEEVYPSILIIPSVNVNQSGVVITTGVNRGGNEDISVSFSNGVGGAVDGQSAESYILYKNGYDELVAPNRETKYRTIPPTGGTSFRYAQFNRAVLDKDKRLQLRKMSQEISDKMDRYTSSEGPYDIELGFEGDKIWLFQVRPFVENEDAQAIQYLKQMEPTNLNKYFIIK